MPDPGRPCKRIRKLLLAQHHRHQNATAGILMASATVFAHAARAMKPMDDETMAGITLEAERESSPTRSDLALKDGLPAVPCDRSLGDLLTSTTQRQSLRSVYNAAKGTVAKKDARQKDRDDKAAIRAATNKDDRHKGRDTATKKDDRHKGRDDKAAKRGVAEKDDDRHKGRDDKAAKTGVTEKDDSHKGRYDRKHPNSKSRSRQRDYVRQPLPQRRPPLRESSPPRKSDNHGEKDSARSQNGKQRKSDQDGEESAASFSKAAPVAALVIKPKSQRGADAAFKVVTSSKREQQLKREVRAPDDDEKKKKTAKPTQVEDEYSYTYEDYEKDSNDELECRSDCSWHGQGNTAVQTPVLTNNMVRIQVFKDSEVFLQHLGDTCFWDQQANAFNGLTRNIKGGFEASLELFHNNYKNHNLRSVVFKCTHCREAVALDYSKVKVASEKAAYTANLLDLLKFFKVAPDKDIST